MNMSRHIPALAAGALLALGAYGCASTDSAYVASGYGSTTDAPQGNRGAYMATIDDQITRDIEQALHAASGVDARDVRVASIRGRVQLEGTVRNDEDRRRIVEIARNTDVERVVGVEDNLRVAG
jgi:osmotically-inducible protein OsmY